ncbi:MAG: Twin-arginine translocation pathway signal, partial [Hydrogenophilales bacterium RIFOXYA1_FULL_63_33]
PDALAEINHVLRDYRNDQVAAIDTRLLDLLDRVKARLGTSQPFQVISGYRSPATNHLLAERSSGVAKHSLHMEGKAIDIRIPGVALADLRKTGLALQAGGVGYYPASDFVHLDVGRVRTWGG